MFGDSDGHLAASPEGARRRLRLHRSEAGRAVRHRAGYLFPHHVDHASEDAAAVENRARPANHVDSPSRGRGERRGVVEAAVDDVAHALAVLEHQDPVSGQAADDRLGGAGPHAVHGDARNRCNRLRDGSRHPSLQFLPRENGGRPDRLVRSRGAQDCRDDEIRQRNGGDFKVDRGRLPVADLEGRRCVPDAIDPELVLFGIRHGDSERAVSVRDGAAARADDRDRRARERHPALRRPDDPLEDALVLLHLRGRRHGGGAQAHAQKKWNCDESLHHPRPGTPACSRSLPVGSHRGSGRECFGRNDNGFSLKGNRDGSGGGREAGGSTERPHRRSNASRSCPRAA